ncbi:DUF3823 domain-containing protein [Niabella hibiscisoli]|uniref:DUF3823 domain-containing protein n=1 Tax=Niabella hibiscisoli TaxID=1825928 RepID=UPI001F0D49DA|nr:DUF3823 domain-containing protein [Niabella hibiscisoli]MCH5719471.1 DUF3823 domain-containing protein [Niabella hibiscisoli]
MKTLLYTCLMTLVVFCSCEKDNYDPPSSQLTGRITFNGEPLFIRQGISVLQLYQPGFELRNPINVNVKQDGTFSSLLFDGDYQLIRVSGNGPWENNTDTIPVKINGSTTLDVSVTPYFTLSDVSFSVLNDSLKASFKINKQSAARQLERVYLVVGKTQLVDNLINVNPSSQQNPDPGGSLSGTNLDLSKIINLSHTLKAVTFIPHAHLYARIAVKTVGFTEMNFSDVFQIR